MTQDEFEQEVATIFTLYNQSWQRNWGFVPVSEAEFKMIAKDLKQIIVDSLVLLVEDRNGRAVGFSVTLPDVNQLMPRNGRLFPFGWYRLLTGMKSVKTGRLFTLGVVLRDSQFRLASLLALGACLLRLVSIDMAQADPVLRGLVFVGVGLLMVGMNAISTRFRDRFGG